MLGSFETLVAMGRKPTLPNQLYPRCLCEIPFFWLVCMNKQWPLTGCRHYLPKHHKCDAGVRRKHYLPHQPTLSVCSMANYCELFLYISL